MPVAVVVSLVLSVASAGPRGGQSAPVTADSAHAARIARIERRLLPATPLSTDADSGWSVEARMRAHHVPGLSVAVVHDGQLAWCRSYGVQQVHGGAAVTPITRFQAGSISKPIAALAVLQLADRGMLSLDADVNRYLRRWRMPSSPHLAQHPVTLRLLLSHRAGITVRGFDGYRRGAPVPSLVQVLEGSGPANSAPIVVDTVPGSINRYSGGGFQVAQLAIEDVSGTRFEDWADAELFAPLGMRHSTFRPMDSFSLGWEVATGHTEAGDTIDGGWRLLPEMAAASLWSTPSDLAALMIALQRAMHGTAVGAVTPGMARQMMEPVSTNQGIGIGLKGMPPFRFSHSGSNDGYRAMFIGYLDRGEGIVAMTNGDDGDALIMEYVRAVAREYGWQDLTPRVRTPVPVQRAVADALVGRYRLAAGWSIDIERRGDGLVAGPTGRALLPLLSENDSSFFFTAVDGVDVQVTRRDAGRVTEIVWRQGERATPGRRDATIITPDRARQ